MQPPEGHAPPPDSGDPSRRVRRVGDREILFDAEGFFWDPNAWSEEAACLLARESGLDTLTDVHWRVLGFLREFYFTNGRAPMNRQLRAGTDMSLMALESLFPGGIKHGARRLSGLPNPRSCM